ALVTGTARVAPLHAVVSERLDVSPPARARRRGIGSRGRRRKEGHDGDDGGGEKDAAQKAAILAPVQRDQPAADGPSARVGATRRARLAGSRGGVKLGGLIADAEPVGYRFVGEPFREQLEDLNLPRRQRLVERLV